MNIYMYMCKHINTHRGNPPDPQNKEVLESETQVVRGYTATTRGWKATKEESIWVQHSAGN